MRKIILFVMSLAFWYFNPLALCDQNIIVGICGYDGFGPYNVNDINVAEAAPSPITVVFRPISSAATTPNIRICITQNGMAQAWNNYMQAQVCDSRPTYSVTKYLSTSLSNAIYLNICVDQDTKYNNDGSLVDYTLIKSDTCWGEAVR